MLRTSQKKYLSDLSLLFVAFVWGGGFVAVKDALNTVTPMVLMSVRFLIATMVLYLFLHRWIGKIEKIDLKKGSIVGVLLYIAFAAQTFGLQHTTASKQGFLTATYVIMVPLIYWILYKRRPSNKALVGSVVTLIGIGLVSVNSDFIFDFGDGLTLICAFFFAAHIIAIEFFAKDMNVFKLAFIQIAIAAVLFVVTALITEPIPTSFTPRAWLAIIYLAVFSTFACFTIQTVAQKYTSSSHVSIILSLESVFAALLGVILLGEVLTPIMLAGCLLIFVSILMVELNFKKK